MVEAITAERLRELLSYDPRTGDWVWLKAVSYRIKAGDPAGCRKHKSGYGQIGIDKRTYLTHRLAWLYMKGEWPTEEVDHRDGVPGNDWWSNLRPATLVQNRRNRKVRVDSTTAVRGVTKGARCCSFRAQIFAEGRQIYLGSYKDVDAAEAARIAAEKHYYGDFAFTQRPGIVLPGGSAQYASP